MRDGGNLVSDPYLLGDFRVGGLPALLYNEYPSRTQVSPVLVPGEATVGVLVIGDSMAANTIPSAYSVAQAKNQNLNISNGGVYASADPLLGPSNGTTPGQFIGSPVTRLGDKMIASGVCSRAILMGNSIGSTKVEDWAVGVLNCNITAAYERFARNGLSMDAVIWHAGPNDAGAGTSQADYAAWLAIIISTVRARSNAPILIGVCSSHSSPNAGIRGAQAAVVDYDNGVWAGVDTDAYASDHFQADGHFNETGADAWATDYATALHATGSPF